MKPPWERDYQQTEPAKKPLKRQAPSEPAAGDGPWNRQYGSTSNARPWERDYSSGTTTISPSPTATPSPVPIPPLPADIPVSLQTKVLDERMRLAGETPGREPSEIETQLAERVSMARAAAPYVRVPSQPTTTDDGPRELLPEDTVNPPPARVIPTTDAPEGGPWYQQPLRTIGQEFVNLTSFPERFTAGLSNDPHKIAAAEAGRQQQIRGLNEQVAPPQTEAQQFWAQTPQLAAEIGLAVMAQRGIAGAVGSPGTSPALAGRATQYLSSAVTGNPRIQALLANSAGVVAGLSEFSALSEAMNASMLGQAPNPGEAVRHAVNTLGSLAGKTATGRLGDLSADELLLAAFLAYGAARGAWESRRAAGDVAAQQSGFRLEQHPDAMAFIDELMAKNPSPAELSSTIARLRRGGEGPNAIADALESRLSGKPIAAAPAPTQPTPTQPAQTAPPALESLPVVRAEPSAPIQARPQVSAPAPATAPPAPAAPATTQPPAAPQPDWASMTPWQRMQTKFPPAKVGETQMISAKEMFESGYRVDERGELVRPGQTPTSPPAAPAAQPTPTTTAPPTAAPAPTTATEGPVKARTPQEGAGTPTVTAEPVATPSAQPPTTAAPPAATKPAPFAPPTAAGPVTSAASAPSGGFQQPTTAFSKGDRVLFNGDPSTVTAANKSGTDVWVRPDGASPRRVRGKDTIQPIGQKEPPDASPVQKEPQPKAAIKREAPAKRGGAVPQGEGEKAVNPPGEGEPPTRIERGKDEPSPPKTHSNRKVDLNRDRAKFRLGKLQSPQTRKFEALHEEALTQYTAESTDEMVREVAATHRQMTDLEIAATAVRLVELSNQYDELLAKVGATSEPTNLAHLNNEIDLLETLFDFTTTTSALTGTETARALNARKLTINNAMDLVSVINRAKAKKGSDLSAAERAAFQEDIRKLEAKNRELETRDQKLQNEEARRELVRERRREPRERNAKKRRGPSGRSLDELIAKVNELKKAGC